MATAVYMGMQGRLFEWFKNEGDEVSRGEVIAEVESMDRVTTIDVHARESGVLRKRLVNTGDEGGAETVIAIIGAPGEDVSPLAGTAGAGASPASVAPTTAPVQEVQQVAAAGPVETGAAAPGETRDEPAERGTPSETPPVSTPAPAPVAAPPRVDGPQRCAEAFW